MGFIKGHIPTKETIEKIRLAHLGRKRKPFSQETKDKIKKANKGKIPWNKNKKGVYSKKTLEMMRNKRKGNQYNKGRKCSNEKKEKIKQANLKYWSIHPGPNTGKINEKASRWCGGISFEPYSIDWKDTLKRAIRERDHYICRICNQYGNFVHHIDYNKLNCSSENLITLCSKCHPKTNTNRDCWIEYFKNL